jgi:hypothetical protein
MFGGILRKQEGMGEKWVSKVAKIENSKFQ